MSSFADCSFCGGLVEEARIEFDYRRKDRLLVITNVPAGVCHQCGEKYFTADVARKMDQLYHDIVGQRQRPDRILEVPAVSF